ncbi:hypothetical protein Tco_0102662, partial [Tanacetum coccineum]
MHNNIMAAGSRDRPPMLATGRYDNQKQECRYYSKTLADTDDEIDEQELEAHYSYMAKIQKVPNANSGTDSEPLEQ